MSLFSACGHDGVLRSFPTRRSSDLERQAAVVDAQQVQDGGVQVVAEGRALGHPVGPLVAGAEADTPLDPAAREDRKSTRLNSSHPSISYAVFCLKKKKRQWLGKHVQ